MCPCNRACIDRGGKHVVHTLADTAGRMVQVSLCTAVTQSLLEVCYVMSAAHHDCFLHSTSATEHQAA